MRFNERMPDNPWPSEMLIAVDEQPLTLLELLWVRESYELSPRGDDLPPLLADTPTPRFALEAGEREQWECAWPQVWRAAVAHIGASRDEQEWNDLAASADGWAERENLIKRMIGPRWSDHFGGRALAGDLHREWVRRVAAPLPRTLGEYPERRDQEALIRAWRSGLTTIVTIPCSTEFTRRIGESTLLLTTETRRSSDAYRRALGTFV